MKIYPDKYCNLLQDLPAAEAYIIFRQSTYRSSGYDPKKASDSADYKNDYTQNYLVVSYCKDRNSLIDYLNCHMLELDKYKVFAARPISVNINIDVIVGK